MNIERKNGVGMLRDEFFQMMENSVTICDGNQFKRIQQLDGLESPSPIRIAVRYSTGLDNRVEIISGLINVNKDAFMIGREDYSDMIPMLIRHEVIEEWIKIKGLARDRSVAHCVARRGEWQLAFELGEEARFSEFVDKFAGKIIDDEAGKENFVFEHEEVKSKVEARFKRRKAGKAR